MAVVQGARDEVRRVMLMSVQGGTYLFCYNTLDDGPSSSEEWFESVDHAEKVCQERYGIESTNWNELPEPLPGCQHDWVAPVRVKGRNTKEPAWGRFEILENGVWTDLIEDDPA